jgi:hypothetical protein
MMVSGLVPVSTHNTSGTIASNMFGSGSAAAVMHSWHHEEPGEVAHLGQIATELCDHASVVRNGLQRR